MGAATWSALGEGEQLWFLGTLAIIRVSGDAVDGRFALIEFLFPHYASPPLHTHPQDESYVVLEGRLTIVAGDRRFELSTGGTGVVPMGRRPMGAGAGASGLRTGGTGVVPRGSPHPFRAEGEPVRFLAPSPPAGIERMVRDGSVPATAATLPPPDAPRPAQDELMRI